MRTDDARAVADNLGYGPLAPDTRAGARVAPALRGLGLLADVPEAAVVAQAADNALALGPVRGRANMVAAIDGRTVLGRFGWKATGTGLAGQTALGFAIDIGLSTSWFPEHAGDCTAAQTACRAGPHGGDIERPEIAREMVAMIADYLASVPPPAAPPSDPEGARLFAATGCAACHRPSLPVRGGTIAPFTDLLLHDLGPGLDGGATESGVAPTEWRTAPLWGLSRALANGTGLLHDGRAASVADAIRWHGGEAETARRRFDALSEGDRSRLLRYLELL